MNATYSYEIVHRDLLEEYRRPEPRPNFLFESSYEHMHDATAQQIRRQAWWPMLCGAFGQVMGNDPLFWFGPGWRAELDSPGTRAMQAWRAFWEPLPWWRLVPDVEGRLVTGWRGAVAGLERVTAAVTPEGDLAVAYLPVARTVDVDLGRLSGPDRGGHLVRSGQRGADPGRPSRGAAGVVALRSPVPGGRGAPPAVGPERTPAGWRGRPDDWATGRPSE